MMKRFFKNKDGFALVEVSIALIVMGVVMGVGLPSFLHYLKWQKIKETQEKKEKILYSLSSFVLQNGYVPLPAPPEAPAESFGLSRAEITQKSDMRGLVPFKTLGLSEHFAKDGFGRYFTYLGGAPEKADPDVGNKASFCRTLPRHVLRVSERRVDGALSDRPAGAEAHDPTVVILMSHGESGHGAYQGTAGNVRRLRMPQNYGADKYFNSSDKLHLVSRGHSRKKGDMFDDMIVWVTRHNLMAFYAKSPCAAEEGHHVGHVVI